MTAATVYTKPNCVQCTMTKRALTEKGVPFEEADILDPQNLEAAKFLGYMAAPVVVAGDDHWAGFRPDKINALVERLNLEVK